EQEVRVDVRAERPIELLVADVLDGLDRELLRRVVDEHVDVLPALLRKLRDRALGEVALRHVAAQERAVRTVALDELGRARRILVLLEVDDAYGGRAFGGEMHGNGSADAGVAARDQRDLTVEPLAADVP